MAEALPVPVMPDVNRLVLARALRALADGYVAVLLPTYLLALGHGAWVVGALSTATLLGSALATLLLGVHGHRWPGRRSLQGAALLMAGTGVALALTGQGASVWPLLLVGFVGTLNPSGGDVSVFLPLEHAHLAAGVPAPHQARLFARYTMAGSLAAAFGALLAALPAWLVAQGAVGLLPALRGMFLLYTGVGLVVWALYRGFARADAQAAGAPPSALGPSRRVVWRLAALFSLDAFAGGLVLNALLALWLGTRFGLSAGEAGRFFFWAGLLTTASQWLAPQVAARVGLLNTMVFTHIPANVCLLLAAFSPSLPWALGWLFLRSALSQMDVPTRSAFVMAVVTPQERQAAASFTTVPRSLAAALSPMLGGALMAAGHLAAPLALCALLKIVYDLWLWRAFRRYAAAPQPPSIGLKP